MTTAKKIIKESGISFGTSGARGLVTDFSSEVCIAFTLAFLQSQKNIKKVAVAIDNRPSSPEIAKACITAAKSYGIGVDYYGVIPTPALAYTSVGDAIPAIMITGSHIPFDRNGLKFYRADGEINKQDEQSILNADIEVPELELHHLPEVSDRASIAYIERYISVFSDDVLNGKRIGVYEHSSAGRDLYYKIFSSLGAEVIALGRSDEFVPIDTEAVARSDIEMAQAWQEKYDLDAIFSTDGDGDRPLLSDEEGKYLRGDILCLLAAKELKIDAVAIPVSCNSVVESCGAFQKVERTKIGSPYVIESIETLKSQYQSTAGFEANGGFLLGCDIKVKGKLLSSLITRDAVLPAVAVLSAAGSNTISSLLADLPARFTASDRLQNFPRQKSLSVIDSALLNPKSFLKTINMKDIDIVKVNQTDGLRMTLSNDVIVHLRPSGNAPELRCYVEADNVEVANDTVKLVLSKLKNM